MGYSKGFIALHRSLLGWEWYRDASVRGLFVHLLLVANWESKKWRGMIIRRGQLVTSRAQLAQETGLSEQQIRTAMKKLSATNEITSEGRSQYTVITIKNYDRYQFPTSETTSEQPANQPSEQPSSNHDSEPSATSQPTSNQPVQATENINENDYNETVATSQSTSEQPSNPSEATSGATSESTTTKEVFNKSSSSLENVKPLRRPDTTPINAIHWRPSEVCIQQIEMRNIPVAFRLEKQAGFVTYHAGRGNLKSSNGWDSAFVQEVISSWNIKGHSWRESNEQHQSKTGSHQPGSDSGDWLDEETAAAASELFEVGRASNEGSN